jgi:hypothetical protein
VGFAPLVVRAFGVFPFLFFLALTVAVLVFVFSLAHDSSLAAVFLRNLVVWATTGCP